MFGLPAFRLPNRSGTSWWVPIVRTLAEEPDAVAEDRAAEREVGVPVLDQRRQVGEAERAQLVVDVAALRPLAGEAAEVDAAEVLPPVFGIMLNAGPPRSTSARPPAIVTCTSLALFMS